MGGSSSTGVAGGAIVRSNSPIVIKDDKVFGLKIYSYFTHSALLTHNK